MEIPTFDEMMLPFLKLVGNEHLKKMKEIKPKIIEHFRLGLVMKNYSLLAW